MDLFSVELEASITPVAQTNHDRLLRFFSDNGYKGLFRSYSAAPPDESWYKNIYLSYPNSNLDWDVTDALGEIFCPETRCHGYILHHLYALITLEGNTLASVNTLYENLMEKIRFKGVRFQREQVFSALAELESGYLVKRIGNSIWHQSLYDSENTIVHALKDIGAEKKDLMNDSAKFRGSLTDTQYKILEAVQSKRIVIVDGLPGTGKTFTTSQIVQYLEDNGIPVWLLAPTGLAAKTLGDRCNRQARTLHSFVFMKNEIVGEIAFIIDEFSMVDTRIFAQFLRKVNACNATIILVGDTGQLPSIGPGLVFRELIELREKLNISYHRLEDIIRQGKESEIIVNAHHIRRGEGGLLNKGQFLFFEKNEMDTSEFLIKFAVKLHDAKKNFIVLSPTHKGMCGVSNLNTHLREIFNPPAVEKMEARKGRWRVGDKILINQNFYDFGLVNGDIGYITDIIDESTFMMLTLDNRTIKIDKDIIETLKHAYALTIHKAQGQEFETVVMPFVNNFTIQLQRKLLYTAVTRAKSQVIIFGNREALIKAIQTDKEERRRTGLKVLMG